MTKLSVSKTSSVKVEQDEQRPELPNGCKWNDDGTVHFTFRKPVVLQGSNQDGPNTVTFSELTFRDLNGGDMIDSIDLGKGSARTVFMLCAATGLGPSGEAVFRAMKGSDYVRAQAVMNVFTNDGP